MASKFECPRCGSGIRPGDYQCDRCGEILRAAPKKAEPKVVREAVVPAKVTKYDAPAEIHIPIPEEKQRDLDQRERAVRERETAVAHREAQNMEITESLEHDTVELETALQQFDQEKSIFQDKNEAMLRASGHLLELTRNVDHVLSELSTYLSMAQSQQMTAEDLEKADRLRERFLKSYESERKKLHREIEESNINDLDKVIELEARLRGAEVELNKLRIAAARTEEEKVAPPIDLTPDPQVLENLFKEVNRQIGIGYVPTPRGDPIPTHIEKFDQILGGGIPSGHLVLISGPPGSMKSTLTYNLLYNSAKLSHMNCMYFSLEQSRDSLLRQMRRLGMDHAEVGERLTVVDMVALRKATEDQPGDWRSILLRYVRNVHENHPLKMFVLDSLASFKSITSLDFSRQDLKDLFDWFKELGITVFLIAEASPHQNDNSSQEAYLADGVMELTLKEIDDSRVQRWVRVSKMRGMNIDTRYHAMFHKDGHVVLTVPMVETKDATD